MFDNLLSAERPGRPGVEATSTISDHSLSPSAVMPADSLHTQLRAAFPGQGSLALETKTGFTKSKARGKAMEGGPCPKPPASVGDMARTRAQDVHATPVLRVGGFSMLASAPKLKRDLPGKAIQGRVSVDLLTSLGITRALGAGGQAPGRRDTGHPQALTGRWDTRGWYSGQGSNSPRHHWGGCQQGGAPQAESGG